MSVQIIIDGKHSTDVLAELKVLSDALNGEPKQLELPLELPKVKVEREVYQGSPEPQEIEISEQNDPKSFGPNPSVDEPIKEEPRKLSCGEHKAEADKMIAAGKRDDEIYPLLSRGQQKRVDEALAAPVEGDKIEIVVDNILSEKPDPTNIGAESSNQEYSPAKILNDSVEEKQEDVGGLFDDEPAEESKLIVTREAIGELIIKKCKDPNKLNAQGQPSDIPEMYAAVRAELKNVVAKDQEPKISNVPESKYAELYQAINSLGK